MGKRVVRERSSAPREEGQTLEQQMKQLNEQPAVLIADDEIPYDDERDRRTREAFRKTRPQATDEEYLKGCNGMRGAVEALRNDGFNPVFRCE